MVPNISGESTVDEDFAGKSASRVEIQFVPVNETSTVSVKDLGIEACIEEGTSDLNTFCV